MVDFIIGAVAGAGLVLSMFSIALAVRGYRAIQIVIRDREKEKTNGSPD